MRTIAKWGLVIVATGLVLGTWLGTATSPVMKDIAGATSSWRPGDGSKPAAQPPAFAEPAPPYLGKGYRPELDYDAEVWGLPISADELGPLYAAPDTAFVGDYPDLGPPPSSGMLIDADDAARAVEGAAQDAAQAAAEASTSDPGPREVRKSDLARSGLY